VLGQCNRFVPDQQTEQGECPFGRRFAARGALKTEEALRR
jgi:hypothetical protein